MEEEKEERGGKTEEKRREMISALWCQDSSRATHGPSSQTPRSGGDKMGKCVWPVGEDVRHEAANSSGAFPTGQPLGIRLHLWSATLKEKRLLQPRHIGHWAGAGPAHPGPCSFCAPAPASLSPGLFSCWF